MKFMVDFPSSHARMPQCRPRRFAGLDIKKQVTSKTYRTEMNKYGVKCGGDLHMWESSGWISTIDPYGWFQCTCNHFFRFPPHSTHARCFTTCCGSTSHPYTHTVNCPSIYIQGTAAFGRAAARRTTPARSPAPTRSWGPRGACLRALPCLARLLCAHANGTSCWAEMDDGMMQRSKTAH